jgi:5-methylcytosine-specific restriction endonuclease McrA
VLEAALDALLEKKDPVKKAERTRLRKVRATTATLTMPASIRHEVNLRDRGKCQFPGCTHTRYVDLHHIIPRSQGGAHTADNLITLCSAHHRIWHRHGTDKPYVPALSPNPCLT